MEGAKEVGLAFEPRANFALARRITHAEEGAECRGRRGRARVGRMDGILKPSLSGTRGASSTPNGEGLPDLFLDNASTSRLKSQHKQEQQEVKQLAHPQYSSLMQPFEMPTS